jgi:hypothetical protein
MWSRYIGLAYFTPRLQIVNVYKHAKLNQMDCLVFLKLKVRTLKYDQYHNCWIWCQYLFKGQNGWLDEFNLVHNQTYVGSQHLSDQEYDEKGDKSIYLNIWSIRVISKVRKTHHQNPEIGHTQGDIQKKLAKKYTSIQQGMKLRKPSILVVNWVSSCLSFFLSTSTAATYIFTAPNCTTTIICLNPCALNAEYQHFILRFIKMSLLCRYHWKRG